MTTRTTDADAAAIEAAIAELVLGAPLALDDDAGLRGLFERHRVANADQAALLAADRARLFVYRELVQHTLADAVERACPRAVARLGARFETDFAAFLAERGPRSRYLRDVVGEWLDFTEPRWHADPTVPPYLAELARFEALQVELAARATNTEPPPELELSLEARLRFTEAQQLLRLQFALHELPEAPSAQTVPERRPTRLLVYRDDAHELRTLELTPFAAELVERLLTAVPLGRALQEAASATETLLDGAVIERAARLLADLAERGVVLGCY